MRTTRAAWVSAALFGFLSTPAAAFLDPPYLTPADPIANETVSVNIHGGQCDTIIAQPGYPQLFVDGNNAVLGFLAQQQPCFGGRSVEQGGSVFTEIARVAARLRARANQS